MRKPTIIDKIKAPLIKAYARFEYFFAKKWLDRHFGEREYWGDYLMENLNVTHPNTDL